MADINRPSTIALAMAAVTGAYAAAVPNVPRGSTCSVTFTGSNSEGAGGIGASEFSTYDLAYEVTGPAGGTYSWLQDGDDAINDTEDASQWGSSGSATFMADYNDSDNTWWDCSVNFNGVVTNGTVAGVAIYPGIVSQTVDTCQATFDC